jgi:hypothetical protein
MNNGVSLHFKLKPGEKADLEVVAAAAIAWVEALRAAAREIAPDDEIRVELIDADESSLILNTALDWVEKQIKKIQDGRRRHKRTEKLALALAVFLIFTAGPTWDFYFGDHKTELSDKDRHLLEGILEKLKKSPNLDAPRRKFFRTLERDASIIGVGFSESAHEAPIEIIPANRFAELGGLWMPEEDAPHEQTTRPLLDVILIRPALVSKPRSWTFKPEGLPEFDATMKDMRFLKAISDGKMQERLREGIPMTIRLEVKEKMVNGVLKLTNRGRIVTEVVSPKID